MEAKACKCLTGEEKKFILANHEEGKSYSESVDKTLEPKPRTDRPPMTTKREARMVVKMSLKDRFDKAKHIFCSFCKQIGKLISRKTVCRWLNKEKLVARIPCRKPLISKKNQKVRLDFATEYIAWREE